MKQEIVNWEPTSKLIVKYYRLWWIMQYTQATSDIYDRFAFSVDFSHKI